MQYTLGRVWEELEEVAHELAETEHENTVLRHNIERIKEEKDFTM